ncbi:hypothetical protein BGZ73_002672 [Actinomortierella ambigua]|nr:hypothetical protein BGZ73_002672 [Actinomortierella ambigua]
MLHPGHGAYFALRSPIVIRNDNGICLGAVPSAKCAVVNTNPPQAWPGLNYYKSNCKNACLFDGWPAALCDIAEPCCHKVVLHNQKVDAEKKGTKILTSTAIARHCGLNPCDKNQYYDEKLQICLQCTPSTCKTPPPSDGDKKPPSQHKLSSKVKECMKGFEGYCSTCYLDTKCKWTIGFGLLQPSKAACSKLAPMSLKQAYAAFDKEIVTHENDVKKYIKVDLTQGQYDALVDMVYHMGITRFRETDTFKYVNNKQFDKVVKRLRSVTGDEASRRAYDADIFEGKLDFSKCPKYTGKNKLCNITTCKKKSK